MKEPGSTQDRGKYQERASMELVFQGKARNSRDQVHMNSYELGKVILWEEGGGSKV